VASKFSALRAIDPFRAAGLEGFGELNTLERDGVMGAVAAD
jgi:hypothetical protein